MKHGRATVGNAGTRGCLQRAKLPIHSTWSSFIEVYHGVKKQRLLFNATLKHPRVMLGPVRLSLAQKNIQYCFLFSGWEVVSLITIVSRCRQLKHVPNGAAMCSPFPNISNTLCSFLRFWQQRQLWRKVEELSVMQLWHHLIR
jgi:hypothetical protein